jgi:hypothetical protein
MSSLYSKARPARCAGMPILGLVAARASGSSRAAGAVFAALSIVGSSEPRMRPSHLTGQGMTDQGGNARHRDHFDGAVGSNFA